MITLPRARISPCSEICNSTPNAGEPARDNFWARSAGVSESNSSRVRFIVRKGDVSVKPYSCTNSQPNSVSMRSIVFVGGGAPATTMRTRPCPGTGPSHEAAASRTMFTTAGAPQSIVTPCSSMRRKISAPSTLRKMMCRPPMPVTA